MRTSAFLAAVFALVVYPAGAQEGEERITDYGSDISVAVNGTLTVTETIAVVSTGEQIRHGIYRDFPTIYPDHHGGSVHVRFDVAHVTRDGHDEPYTTESIDNGVRVKIGSADTYVDPGPHTYTLSYVTDRQIGFFDNFDELYWNVTGNGWIFPIQHAWVTIRLPADARIVKSAYYTGAQGSTDRNAVAQQISGSRILITTTTPLGPNEGLTVAVGFTKGAVLPPSEAEKRADFIRDNASLIVALLGLAVVTIFYLSAWWAFGRDPRRGTIVPLFAPPADLSPEAVRYIHRMAYDRKSFAAALINMAVRGFLTISEDHGTYTLTATGKSEVETKLSSAERAISKAFFDGEDAIKLHGSIELKQDNHTAIQAAVTGLKTSLKTEYERHYFVNNFGWFFGGLAILALVGVAAAMLADDPAASGFLLLWLSGWSVGVTFLLHRTYDAWVSVFSGPGSRILNIFSALFATAFALPFAGGEIFALYAFSTIISPWAMAALALGGVIAYVFFHLLKAPTLAGAPIRDQIDGFKLFLNTAEKDRLEMLNPPNVTPALFEKFLPYAIALDCENTWSKKFEAEAAAAGNAGNQTGYVPIWYTGSSFGRLGAAGFASSIGSSLASSAASAAVAPGSSSGSGGGGFSGGGGGGGGGGGW